MLKNQHRAVEVIVGPTAVPGLLAIGLILSCVQAAQLTELFSDKASGSEAGAAVVASTRDIDRSHVRTEETAPIGWHGGTSDRHVAPSAACLLMRSHHHLLRRCPQRPGLEAMFLLLLAVPLAPASPTRLHRRLPRMARYHRHPPDRQ